jgi:hypothetical protein
MVCPQCRSSDLLKLSEIETLDSKIATYECPRCHMRFSVAPRPRHLGVGLGAVDFDVPGGSTQTEGS